MKAQHSLSDGVSLLGNAAPPSPYDNDPAVIIFSLPERFHIHHATALCLYRLTNRLNLFFFFLLFLSPLLIRCRVLGASFPGKAGSIFRAVSYLMTIYFFLFSLVSLSRLTSDPLQSGKSKKKKKK